MEKYGLNDFRDLIPILQEKGFNGWKTTGAIDTTRYDDYAVFDLTCIQIEAVKLWMDGTWTDYISIDKAQEIYQFDNKENLQGLMENIMRRVFAEHADDDTLERMADFGMGEHDIDDKGYVTLYHGGKELPEFLRPNETLFMTNDISTAESYARLRKGKVFTILAKPEDLFWNTGSYEIEFDSGGEFLYRDYPDDGVYILYPNKRSIHEEITIPIEVGDVILGGKFKNKKITVKEIGKNEKGEVTINGKPLMRFRIPK